jgi:predicted RNA binding protein YcfA (HicA-like mRNA interferase family)
LRRLFPLTLCENLFQPLSFDCNARPGGQGHLLCELQQILSHNSRILQ